MSLFTFKEVCSYDFNEPNCYNSKCVTVANIDNEENSAVKIVIGSYTGVLRIFGVILPNANSNVSGGEEDAEFPVASTSNSGVGNSSKSGVLLAEIKLSSPIFQIEAGRFVSGSDKIHLAILHAFKLSVYSVVKVAGQVEHGSQYKVTLLFEHALKRHSFNFCFGAFGHGGTQVVDEPGKRLRHFFCVQSLDGTLSFYEQEVYTFSRYISGTLVPGPIAYISTLDSFITCNSQRLHCFKYSALATANVHDNYKQTEETSLGVRVQPEWTYPLGEDGIDIQILVQTTNISKNSTSPVKILVTTFRSIFCFENGGQLVWYQRLEFNVSCVHSFLHETDDEFVSLVTSVSEPNVIYVYNKSTLKWAAKLNSTTPIFISRISIKEYEGLILVLSSNGNLSVGFFGTEPSLFVAPPIQSRDLDYISAEKELQELRKIIASAGEQDILAHQDKNVELNFDFEGQRGKWIEDKEEEIQILIGTVKIQCNIKVNDLRVTVITPKPMVCFQESVFIGDIVGRQNYPIEFYLENSTIPSDLNFDICLFYVNDSGAPHILQKTGLRIPLSFFAKPNPTLEREADCKLTFSVNKPVLYLANIYDDFDWFSDSNSTGLTFDLKNGDQVTLLASTKSNSTSTSRYRIQSNYLIGIYLLFEDFLQRIKVKYKSAADLKISFVVGEEFPLLAEFFDEIDAHILRRMREIKIKEELEFRAVQLRSVQRRLLLRFRDKNPIHLTNQETLLDGSLDQINDVLNLMAENKYDMEKSEYKLSAGIRLMCELAVINSGKDSLSQLDLLSAALSPNIYDFSGEKGWEENTQSALTFLKSGFSPNSTLSGNDQNFTNFDPIKFKKIIKGSLEKIRKTCEKFSSDGGKSTDGDSSSPAGGSFDFEEKLVGNEIIERMASARARTAKKRQKEQVLPSIPEKKVEPDDGEVHGELEEKPTIASTSNSSTFNLSKESQESVESSVDSMIDDSESAGTKDKSEFENPSNSKPILNPTAADTELNGPTTSNSINTNTTTTASSNDNSYVDLKKVSSLIEQNSFNNDDNFW